ncbi:hypothetical protein ACFY0G_42625 [Streptomyces sp. NPDC001552]
MLSWDSGDYDVADYRRLCPDGGELVVFVTEPCWAKAPTVPGSNTTATGA